MFSLQKSGPFRHMNYPEKAQRVIDLEIEELQRLRSRVGDAFTQAIERIMETLRQRRKLVVCGIGKSGNIGRKLAATLNSTGATTVVLNAQDALHGDLGMIEEGDLAILLSYSGETSELLNLLPHLRRMSLALVAITGNPDSTLASSSDITLDVNVSREACPLNLAPTSSTTIAVPAYSITSHALEPFFITYQCSVALEDELWSDFISRVGFQRT